jgi:eukaryotic-like serine/threonine-protein kinase
LTADIYQQSKALFAELLDADDTLREQRLSELRQKSPELEQEVRSLLEFHTAQSLIAPPSTPKIRTRSTLSTTHHNTHSLKWAVGPLRGLLAAVPLFLVGLAVGYLAEQQLRHQQQTFITAHLEELIDFRVAQIRNWEQRQIARVTQWVEHPQVSELIESLVESVRTLTPEDPQLVQHLSASDCCLNLSTQLAKRAGRPVKFAVWDRRMLTLVDWNQRQQPHLLAATTTAAGANMLAPVLRGQSKLFLPHASFAITEGFIAEKGPAPLSILVPVVSPKSGAVIAAIMLRGFGLEEEYVEMLQRWTNEAKGETYLISQAGDLLTRSRYDQLLNELPLAHRQAGGRERLLVRDPGVDLLAGERPEAEPGSWLPTLLARKVAAGENGSFAQGYRNYVGQLVVGAWRWLPDHEIGIALEQDYHSSYAMVRSTRGAIYLMSGLFSVALIGFLTAVAVGERRQRLRDVSEVGPYQIQELLGEGGMGRVYLAEHALLCRQSAIKVLTKGDTDLSIISRFEREVQLASQLTHPNTISIFDFGRSRDGVFYYAMEYIHGAHLGQLVEYVGPLPPGRCIYILRQLCRALLEAHHAGVVHRDIKPQNIMVCNRGGEPDFVKLFDYGLVKAFAPGVSPNQSQTKVVVGTPRFMAPERLNSPWLADPRVDVYSVGALAYYLLTAQLPPLVTAGEDHEQEQPGVETLDLPPAVVEFGGLLSLCMSVEPASRPSNMTSVLRELDGLGKKFPWSREDSELWWSKNEEKLLRLVRSKRLRLKPDGDRFWKK